MPTDAEGAHAEQRLRDEKVGSLTTVRRDGQPQSGPVWFLWRGDEVVVNSKLKTQKVRNVRENVEVSSRMDPASFSKSYSLPIRIRLTKLRFE